MIVYPGRRVTIDDGDTARHSEMDYRRAVGCIDQQVLCAPADRNYRLAGEVSVDVGADRPAQSPIANSEFVDTLADKIWLDATAAGFDFRELRHAARALLDLRFLVDHVLANRWVVFLGFHLFRMEFLVFFRRVEMPGAGTRDEPDFFAITLGHRLILSAKFADPADACPRRLCQCHACR